MVATERDPTESPSYKPPRSVGPRFAGAVPPLPSFLLKLQLKPKLHSASPPTAARGSYSDLFEKSFDKSLIVTLLFSIIPNSFLVLWYALRLVFLGFLFL